MRWGAIGRFVRFGDDGAVLVILCYRSRGIATGSIAVVDFAAAVVVVLLQQRSVCTVLRVDGGPGVSLAGMPALAWHKGRWDTGTRSIALFLVDLPAKAAVSRHLSG